MQKTADLVKFTKEIRNGKMNFLCSVFVHFLNKICGQTHFLRIKIFSLRLIMPIHANVKNFMFDFKHIHYWLYIIDIGHPIRWYFERRYL